MRTEHERRAWVVTGRAVSVTLRNAMAVSGMCVLEVSSLAFVRLGETVLCAVRWRNPSERIALVRGEFIYFVARQTCCIISFTASALLV